MTSFQGRSSQRGWSLHEVTDQLAVRALIDAVLGRATFAAAVAAESNVAAVEGGCR
jgi:hypothetical protein